MANETFESTVNSVAQTSDLPQSQGAFQKEPAQQALSNMEIQGGKTLSSQEILAEAHQRLEAITNVTPEVNQAARTALEATTRSLEAKSRMSEVQVGFWGFVRSTFGKDPYMGNIQRGKQQLEGAVQYIRETGATGRAMTTEDERRHQMNREMAKQQIERASEPRRLSLREKIFNWANEKATNAMVKHEQLNNAIGSLKEQMSRVTQKVSERLQTSVEAVQQDRDTYQQKASESAEKFEQSVSQAQATNYTGYN